MKDHSAFHPQLDKRRRYGTLIAGLLFAATMLGLLVLATLIVDVVTTGSGWLSEQFLTGYPTARPETSGIWPAIVGSLYLMLIVAATTVPLGVGTALYLEEYADEGGLKRIIQLNITNLAGVPSVVYGILGLGVFVYLFDMGSSLLAAGLTLSLLVLPIVVISAQEALRSIPQGVRESAFALGATRSQVIWHHLIPMALPGIMTGVILSLSRAVGETAPLVLVGASLAINFTPAHLLDDFTALPMLVFQWTEEPGASFQELAAAAIIVLMAFLLLMNLSAILLRNHFEDQLAG
ncbi:phosphate ABC transporter, permease protein PstA [Longimonas halophila]|uniref:Phosphate transport system permease protein PstA n=1 Tax=Longimonas halophila TaxID=1469170 RepID=A0A2H3NRU7_9BACT|nr:phosphate ABC transporter permease PstA [Longimonas halophila]PEN06268.1 phosphate ABC transporter, permease protein PstA [Longimonas halophila]